jgi:putative ABC transport system permease protein
VPRPREIGFSVPEVNDYRSASTTIEEFAEYSSASTALPFTFRSGNELPIRPSVAIVSGNYFRVLGLDAELGRLIDPADGAPSAAPVAVFSHEFWTTHFGADPRIIGRVVSLNDLPVVIIGVARPAAPYPERTDVFANTASSAHHLSAMMTTSRTHRMSQVFARLAPGATLEQAQRELAGLAARAYRDHAEAYDSTARYELSVLRLRDAVNGSRNDAGVDQTRDQCSAWRHAFRQHVFIDRMCSPAHCSSRIRQIQPNRDSRGCTRSPTSGCTLRRLALFQYHDR